MRAPPLHQVRQTGFTLLPVILAMSLIAAIAFLLNRDNGFNARMTASQSDLDRARYAAEAGLQAVNFRIQATGCGAPSMLVPTTAFDGATYSASSTTPSASSPTPLGSPLTVRLDSTGTYNGTSVKLTRDNVYVYQAVKFGGYLQPGPTTGQDTYLDIVSPGSNYGGSDPLQLWTGKSQPLLRFDLTGLPQGSRVIPWYDSDWGVLRLGASLYLYQTKSGLATSGQRVYVHLVTQSWLAGTGTEAAPSSNGATWNTYDGSNNWPSPGMGYASIPVASASYVNAVGWVPPFSSPGWDLTNVVAGWLSGVYPNYGMRLIPSSGVNPFGASIDIGETHYASSSSSLLVDGEGRNTSSARPVLVLWTYLVPCGTTEALTREVTAVATDDAQIRCCTTALKESSYGASTLMAVTGPATTALPPQDLSRVLVKFDLSDIPSGSTIQSASMRLYVERIDAQTSNEKKIDAYVLTKEWKEGDETGGSADNAGDVSWKKRGAGSQEWNTTGGGGDVEAGAPIATQSLPNGFSQGWVTWDVTTLVQAWRNGTKVNYGVLLKTVTVGTDQVQFRTEESGTPTLRPELRVTYK